MGTFNNRLNEAVLTRIHNNFFEKKKINKRKEEEEKKNIFGMKFPLFTAENICILHEHFHNGENFDNTIWSQELQSRYFVPISGQADSA